MRAAYLDGQSIAALARTHHVSRGAIRTAVADLMPDHTADVHEDVPAPEAAVTLDVPGKVAAFLRAADLDPAERAALDQGVTVRRGQGYTLRVSAVPSVTAHSSPAASHSPAPRRSRHSARPVARTRTASAPSSTDGLNITRSYLPLGAELGVRGLYAKSGAGRTLHTAPLSACWPRPAAAGVR